MIIIKIKLKINIYYFKNSTQQNDEKKHHYFESFTACFLMP